ncbi:MAG: bifunctional precorrin-2 dehydrogenase/sirohydrochlorin ferrochelatase [Methanobrevibacter sp.]|jgi:precorrin-2 dehydrogenase/sirohydrochlorin ferrochelatase|nr:bifunctional precorrin-2 dehydrogenase/sirohydrochlorin ferrochelatase [Candidatus Methanovirga basalitermitum]
MEWTSLFLKMKNKKVFVLGSGEVGLRRAKRFFDAGSEVIIAGTILPKELKGIRLKQVDIKNNVSYDLLNELKELVDWSDLVVVASENHELNEEISLMAENKLLNRADLPQKGNIIVPTKFSIDSIEISIYTGGKSPIIAKELKKRISKAITHIDILQIELQDYSRNILKEKKLNQKERKEILLEIFNDDKIKKLIEEENLEEAKKYVLMKIGF